MEVKRFCIFGDWVYGKDRFGEVGKCPRDLNAVGPHYVLASDFDRVAAERDALQVRLTAADEHNDRLISAINNVLSTVCLPASIEAVLISALDRKEKN